MKWIAMAVLLVACRGERRTSADEGDELAKMKELEDSMCACKDKACADQVTEQYVKWGAKQTSSKRVLRDVELKQMGETTQRYTECATTALMAGREEALLPDAAVAPARTKTKTEKTLERLTQFRDEMCGCTDKACADAIDTLQEQWTTGRANPGGTEDEKRIRALVHSIQACALEAGKPVPVEAPLP